MCTPISDPVSVSRGKLLAVLDILDLAAFALHSDQVTQAACELRRQIFEQQEELPIA